MGFAMELTAYDASQLPPPTRRGKVRDLYDLGDELVLVASDRVSAFDCVMREPIPGKGVVLTRLSAFWLARLPACQPHHLLYVVERERCPAALAAYAAALAGRAMVCRKADVLPVECVVRGYLVGGGWKEYQQTGRVSGVELPRGLQLAEKLPAPIFTPSTKAARGHDEPISFEEACAIAGEERMVEARARAIEIYQQAAAHAAARAMIVADTKFEFGVQAGRLLLVDEVLTPDSSRFWDASTYRPGVTPPSFDKQFIRDYLDAQSWDKKAPPPSLPPDVVQQSCQRYIEAAQRLGLSESK
jgi:phosphoribosylaminoimidazole-succinocarboxamide synthase